MEDLQHEFIVWSNNTNRTTLNPEKSLASLSTKLTCVDREQGQPNYYEMFQYATDANTVNGDVVILANADQAFDDTAHWASLIKSNTVLVLPTQGYSYTAAPKQVTNFFQFAFRHRSRDVNLRWDKVSVRKRCNGTGGSWDGYVFHRDFVRGRLQPGDFVRNTRMQVWNNITNSSEPVKQFFTMNEMGAENAGLWGLLNALSNATDADGCDFIRIWHFHNSRKMHPKARKFSWAGTRNWVPKPWWPQPPHQGRASFIVSHEEATLNESYTSISGGSPSRH
jgi:hypothetical protein